MDNSVEQDTVHVALSSPGVFLSRMFVFLVLSGFLGAILYAQAFKAFMANPGLNGLILGVLLIGTLYAFRQVIRLYPEIRWVNNYRVSDPGLSMQKRPTLLAPMANLLAGQRGHLSISTGSMRSIMDSIGSRLDEARDTSRYLIGLLIFLGLLGTFWGLLQTIQSIGQTIGSLNTGANSMVAFEELKNGLEAPLKGMGTAFSSSLFGLAGSLILGFLDLQAGQAQNRFYNELEEWLSGITELTPAGASGENMAAQLRHALSDLQRTIVDLGDRVGSGGGGGLDDGRGEAAKELAIGVEKLVKQMRSEQKIVREWMDEQAGQQSEVAGALRDLTKKLG